MDSKPNKRTFLPGAGRPRPSSRVTVISAESVPLALMVVGKAVIPADAAGGTANGMIGSSSSSTAACVSVAVTVTTLVGQRELVTRPLPPEVAENSALSGAAVMSDGQIALIVDCDALETAEPALVTAGDKGST